jgi:hypothetical protein
LIASISALRNLDFAQDDRRNRTIATASHELIAITRGFSWCRLAISFLFLVLLTGEQ